MRFAKTHCHSLKGHPEGESETTCQESRQDGAVTTPRHPKASRKWSVPAGTRLICRRERAHPGAQFKFTDHDGHRFTSFLTDTEGEGIAGLELRHRQRARIEDSIRCGKETGMRNLPFHDYTANRVWLELSLMAQDLLSWTKALVLCGELALAEPKRLRQRLLHVAGRIVRPGRRVTLRLPRSWPWARALEAAFARLRALPAPLPARTGCCNCFEGCHVATPMPVAVPSGNAIIRAGMPGSFRWHVKAG